MRKSILIVFFLPLLAGCEGVHTGKKEPNTFDAGYQRGRSDSAKEYYWNLQDQQRQPQP
jgi:hypothetical protein